MQIYTSRKQAEKVIIALTTVYGSKDEDALKLIDRISKVLLLQCKKDKSHVDN